MTFDSVSQLFHDGVSSVVQLIEGMCRIINEKPGNYSRSLGKFFSMRIFLIFVRMFAIMWM